MLDCVNPTRVYDQKAHRWRYFGCGCCLPCRMRRRQEWSLRLEHELSFWDKACFVTLTYDDRKIRPFYVYRPHLTQFFKTLRNDFSNEKKAKFPVRKIKYFACGEYGGKFGREHFHAIIFGISVDEMIHAAKHSWFNQHGAIYVEPVHAGAIPYVAGYVCDKLSPMANKRKFGEHPPFQTQSQGIGLRWAEKHRDALLKYKCIKVGEKEYVIPRYYLKKLFPKDGTQENELFYIALSFRTLQKTLVELTSELIPKQAIKNWIYGRTDAYTERILRIITDKAYYKTEKIVHRMNLRRKAGDWINPDDYVKRMPHPETSVYRNPLGLDEYSEKDEQIAKFIDDVLFAA